MAKWLVIHEHQTPPGQGGGGAESMLRDQTEALRRLGHEVAWLHSLHVEQAIAEFKPDIVQVQTIHNFIGFAPAVYLQEHDIPHVWVLMDMWVFCGNRMCLKNWDESCAAVQGVCDGNCDKGKAPPEYLEIVNRSFVIALNRYTADIYRRNGLRCDAVVNLGVDTEVFKPDYSKRKGPAVYTSSAWAPYPAKGMRYLQEAVKGTGIMVNLLTDLPREQVAEGLKEASIFVFPSTYEETFGLSLCEAMASGCACIASDVAGARAQIEDGETGILVPPRDANAIRSALQLLLDHPDLADELGRNAREKVLRENTLEAMGRRFEKVYNSVLQPIGCGATGR